MKCVMCPCNDISLLKLQTYIDHKTLNEITFVIPDFTIPAVQGPLYACTTCSKQLTSFYGTKESCLKNLSLLKQRKDILKKSSDLQFNELKILIPFEDISVNSNYKDLLSSEGAGEDEDESQLTEKISNSSNDKESKYQREKAFTTQRILEHHTSVHTGEKSYKCPTCQKTFIQSSHLTRHELTHTGEKPHKCDICYKTFSDKSNLIRHNRLHRHMRSHTKEKPYQCHTCSHKCAQAADLKQHIRTHTGEKPYTCKICKKLFTQSSSLKLHERKLHNNQHLI